MTKRGKENAAVEATTRIVAVFGDPVDHSLSPRMHNAAFQELGLDYVYVAMRPQPRRLSDAIRAIRTFGWAGVNITVPFKEDAIRHVDRVTDTVKVVGALNTIYLDGKKLVGDNTDVAGFASALSANGFRIRGKRVLLIGAGGAARAVMHALLSGGVADVVVANRTPKKARRLAKAFPRHHVRIQVSDLEILEDFDFLATRQLVINATSLGLQGGNYLDYDVEATPDDCLHFDLAYAEKLTAFLELASGCKRPIIDGRHMLVHQGAAAFKLFTGRRAPVEVMAKAIGIKTE